MASKKKQELQLRFYEVPQGELVLPLIGPSWIRDYGHDTPYFHFHNLMEIGYCIDGEGTVTLDGKDIPYETGMLTVIPRNYPHTTIRNCREIICIFLESMLIYVMNEFSDSGGHFHGT